MYFVSWFLSFFVTTFFSQILYSLMDLLQSSFPHSVMFISARDHVWPFFVGMEQW